MLQRILQIRLSSWVKAHCDLENSLVIKTIDHTLCVCDSIKMICIREHFSEEEQDLAIIIGAVHDIGRFEQIARTGSIEDTPKFNHALLGAEMLEEGLLQELLPETRMFDRTIIEVVRTHSLINLPKDMSPSIRRYSEVLQDADRIDIIRGCVENFQTTSWFTDDPKGTKLTPEVREDFMLRNPIDYKNCKNSLDLLASKLEMVFHYNFKGSLWYIKDMELLECLKKRFTSEFEDVYDSKDLRMIFEVSQGYVELNK